LSARRNQGPEQRACSETHSSPPPYTWVRRLIVAIVAQLWHDCGMTRTRLSTTVDGELLAHARRTRAGASDAELIDEALTALLALHRAAEIDAEYAAAYSIYPLDSPDEWGDLESFRNATTR
jgi:hypothetical protein